MKFFDSSMLSTNRSSQLVVSFGGDGRNAIVS